MRAEIVERRLIALFGVSGVGKSTLANEAVKRWPDSVIHLVASDLIAHISELRMVDGSGLASIEDILSNQYGLIRKFRCRAPAYSGKVIIFDGHSVVTNGFEVIEVPVDVISALSPRIIVFLQDVPERILKRRASDTKRARSVTGIEQIESEQSLALRVCRNYAVELSMPILVCNRDNMSDFEELVESLIIENY